MKIILVSPHFYIANIGIRSLSASLKKEGHEVNIIFLPRKFNDTYTDKVLEQVVKLSLGADLIGISLMTNDLNQSVRLTSKIKASLNTPIIWGGIHPTLEPKDCLNHADMVCVGEGEEALKELVTKMHLGHNLHSIQNIWFNYNGKIITNQPRPLIQDLESVPWPDCDFSSHYVLHNGQIVRINQKLMEKYMGHSYLTVPTRGCPNNCTYCCNNKINKLYPKQNMLRKRFSSTIKELLEAKNNLPFIQYIVFDDDALLSCTEEEIGLFCEEYKNHLSLPFRVGGITPLNLTRKKLSLLVNAGLIETRMGIQSASKRILGTYNRNHSNQQIENAIRLINEFKHNIIWPSYDIMLDNPWQTDDDLIETLMFLSRLPVPFTICLFSLTFYPGTELYERAKRESIIKNGDEVAASKCYSSYKNTYLNQLFLLLNFFTGCGIRIPPQIMSLLTSEKLRSSTLAKLLLDLVLLFLRILRFFRREFIIETEALKGNRFKGASS